MRAYIDSKNLISLFSSNTERLFNDCIRMLKSQFDLFFCFKKEEFESNELLNAIVIDLLDGAGETNTIKTGINYPERPLKTNFHVNIDNIEDLSAVYLLDDENIYTAKEKGCLLIGGVGEEIETLSRLFFEDYQFSKTLTPKYDMPKWDAISTYVLPCSDIIIVDRYLFSNEEIFDFNIHYFLKILGGEYLNKKLNIVIFTCYEQEYTDSQGKKKYRAPIWKDIKKNIRSSLKEKYISAPNITLITLRKIKEHDRTIFTNYVNHYSGDSLNYYDSKWVLITNGRHYTLHSHGSRENLCNAYYFIKDMQAEIDRLVRIKNLDAIVGDKKSNFLKFPD